MLPRSVFLKKANYSPTDNKETLIHSKNTSLLFSWDELLLLWLAKRVKNIMIHVLTCESCLRIQTASKIVLVVSG